MIRQEDIQILSLTVGGVSLRDYLAGGGQNAVDVDMDRVPYGQGTITLHGVPDDLRTAIDPRGTPTEAVLRVSLGQDLPRGGGGYWQPQPDLWVVDTPAQDIPHAATTVYSNDGSADSGWTTTVIPNGSGATSATFNSVAAGPNPPRRRLTVNAITTAVMPACEATASRTIATTPGLSYTATAKAGGGVGWVKSYIQLGSAQSALTTTDETALSVSFVATGTATTLIAGFQSDPAGTPSTTVPRRDYDAITVTQDAWTEHVPEVGHWEPQAPVWVPPAVIIRPPSSLADLYARMLLRRTVWDAKADTLTLTLATREALLMDRIRISSTGAAADTGATTLAALVTWALNAADGGATFVDNAGLGAIALPAGDRRLHQHGESYWDLIESELNAAGARLVCNLAGGWFAVKRGDPVPASVFGTSSPTPLTAATWKTTADLAVTQLTQTLDRDDWADGIGVTYTYKDAAGTSKTSYQSSVAGGTKGLIVTYDRAPSSTNLAAGILARVGKRGSSYELVTNLLFTAKPGDTLTELRPSATWRPSPSRNLGTIRAVSWDLDAAEMTLTTETGAPA